MQDITLDGNDMITREAAHDELFRRLSLPLYYGRNLDALHDCLTDIAYPVRVTIDNAQALRKALGGYAMSMLRVFRDAAQKNANLIVQINE